MSQEEKNNVAICFWVKAKPGKRTELIDFLNKDCAECAAKEPRTLRFDVFQDPNCVHAFFVYEAYEDTAAFTEHKKNQSFQTWESPAFQNDVVACHHNLFVGTAECLLSPPPSMYGASKAV